MGVPEKECAEVGIGVSVGGNGEYVGSGLALEVAVGIPGCVSAIAVPTMTKAVSIVCVGGVLRVGRKLLQEVSNTATRRNEVVTLLAFFIFLIPFMYCDETPNGVRYPLVGGTRQRHFDGTNFKPYKLPENAPTPTRRVHAVLGCLNRITAIYQYRLYHFSMPNRNSKLLKNI